MSTAALRGAPPVIVACRMLNLHCGYISILEDLLREVDHLRFCVKAYSCLHQYFVGLFTGFTFPPSPQVKEDVIFLQRI